MFSKRNIETKIEAIKLYNLGKTPLELAKKFGIILLEETRTIQGFEDLIEREWVRYGYPFAPDPEYIQSKDIDSDYDEGASFTLFIDCVHHMMSQNPARFAFTEDYLVILMDTALARGGGLPPFSVEFSASCEAARCPRDSNETSSPTSPKSVKICEDLRNTGVIRFFRDWSSVLTSNGISLIANPIYSAIVLQKHLKRSNSYISPVETGIIKRRMNLTEFCTGVLNLNIEPIALLDFWIHGFLRWNRQARLAGLTGYAGNAALLRLYFGNEDKYNQVPIYSSAFPYSGWLSDEAIDDAQKNKSNETKYKIIKQTYTDWFKQEYPSNALKLVKTWSSKL